MVVKSRRSVKGKWHEDIFFILSVASFFLSFVSLILAAWSICLSLGTEKLTYDTLDGVHTELEYSQRELDALNKSLDLIGEDISNSEYLIESPKLNVTHVINEDYGMIHISIKNEAKLKETGKISFYRLEISDSIPYLQLDSLEPGEEKAFDVYVNVLGKVNYSIIEQDDPAVSCEEREFEKPETLATTSTSLGGYFLADILPSLSYRITCENCPSEGVVKRIPDAAEGLLNDQGLNLIGNKDGKLYLELTTPAYTWKVYNLTCGHEYS